MKRGGEKTKKMHVNRIYTSCAIPCKNIINRKMSVNTPKAFARISLAALFLKEFIPSCHIDSAMNIRGAHSQEGNLTAMSLHMLQAHLTDDQFLSPTLRGS